MVTVVRVLLIVQDRQLKLIDFGFTVAASDSVALKAWIGRRYVCDRADPQERRIFKLLRLNPQWKERSQRNLIYGVLASFFSISLQVLSLPLDCNESIMIFQAIFRFILRIRR